MLPTTTPLGTSVSIIDPTNTPTWPAWNYDTTSRRGQFRLQVPYNSAASAANAVVFAQDAYGLPGTWFCYANLGYIMQFNTGQTTVALRAYSYDPGAGGSTLQYIWININVSSATTNGSSIYVSAGSNAAGPSIGNSGFDDPVQYLGIMFDGSHYTSWIAPSSGNWNYIGSNTTSTATGQFEFLFVSGNATMSPGAPSFDMNFFRCYGSKALP